MNPVIDCCLKKKNSYNNDISHIADRYRVYDRSFLKL